MFRIAFLSVLCALGFLGCAGSGDGASLREVKEFNSFAVYYAGDEVEGEALEEVEGEDWQTVEREIRWTFYYGDCDASSGLFDDGGCMPPLQIQNHSICKRWPGTLSGQRRTFAFRGTRASWSRGNGLEVFTGRTTVVIFGTRDPAVKAAGRQLRTVNQSAPPPTLPPPAPGALRGELPCQG